MIRVRMGPVLTFLPGIIVNMNDVSIVEFVGVFHDENANLFLQFWSPLPTFCFFYVFCYIET